MAYTRYSIYAVARNEVALQRAEMSMVRWMCGVKLQDRVPSKELRGRLGLDDNFGTTAKQVMCYEKKIMIG